MVGPSPFGTDDARTEFKSAAESGSPVFMNRFQNVFTVDVRTGAVVTALRRQGGSPGIFSSWRIFL